MGLDAELKRFALLGEPLGHSLSPVLHKAIYRQLEIDDASYRTVEIPEERLKSFFSGFRVGGFDGVNVTIPHKATVIPLLDEVEKVWELVWKIKCFLLSFYSYFFQNGPSINIWNILGRINKCMNV